MSLTRPGGGRTKSEARDAARIYDRVGHGYARVRREDPRILARILRGLDSAHSVLNAGAGAGSYEPRDRRVVALEPSRVMISQRGAGSAPVVMGSASAMPFRDAAFDAALAVLTLHHWSDCVRGLEEMRRSARGPIVILTWDPASVGFWLADYVPEIVEVDRRIFPSMELLKGALGPISVTDVPIPFDCTDGFLGAYWRRPERYLDPEARAAISTFAKLDDPSAGLSRLEADLASGVWHQRYGRLLERSDLDLGYRLVVA